MNHATADIEETPQTSAQTLRILVLEGEELHRRLAVVASNSEAHLSSMNVRWLAALARGLRHEPYLLEARAGNQLSGTLPLLFVRTALFGRFLVSLPYVNTAGVECDDPQVATALIDRAAQLANELDVRYLELRHEALVSHPKLTASRTDKVHMRLPLPATAEALWASFKPKVRNQIRKGDASNLTAHWGREDLLGDFYAVFSHNMRDLGTPVFSRRLFREILAHFPDRAEFCVIRSANEPVAAALLIHDDRPTQVPSASSLRAYNSTNANMWMYWQLLQRAIDRGQETFDFGRSTIDGNTFRFKKQWGAQPQPACWQYYVRRGEVGGMRPDNPKYRLKIAAWKRMPVWLTRLIGPAIVRRIP